MKSTLPKNTVPEFYFFQRFKFDWHIVFYSHSEQSAFTSTSEAAFTRRESLVRDFVWRLRKRLGLRQSEMLFLGATEFGETMRGHIHLLLSFDDLRAKGKTKIVDRTNKQIEILTSLVAKEMFKDRLKIGIEPVCLNGEDQRKMLSYVCKHEPRNDYKHCFFSNQFNTPDL